MVIVVVYLLICVFVFGDVCYMDLMCVDKKVEVGVIKFILLK